MYNVELRRPVEKSEDMVAFDLSMSLSSFVSKPDGYRTGWVTTAM
jgi:hypothetical protein